MAKRNFGASRRGLVRNVVKSNLNHDVSAGCQYLGLPRFLTAREMVRLVFQELLDSASSEGMATTTLVYIDEFEEVSGKDL
jgi:hypothetical protein